MTFYKTLTGVMLTTALCASPAFAKNAPILKVENFIGTLTVVTGDFDRINIVDADGLSIAKTGDNVRIDTGKNVRAYNCNYKKNMAWIGKGGGWFSKGKNYKKITAYPHIVINAPSNIVLDMDKSIIFAKIGDVGSAHMRVSSCGDVEIGNINGPLNLGISGSGDVIVGNAGITDLDVSGSGDFTGKSLAAADIHVSGSGDVEILSINGPVDMRSSGSSDIDIGRVEGGLAYKGSGSSDLNVDYVSGDKLSLRTSGSGDIDISDGQVDLLYIKAAGASDIVYSGKSVNAEAWASGASDVVIHNPSGQLRMGDSGAADVHIR